jgi:hypothetical protein
MLRGGLGVVDAMPRLDSVDERAKTSGAATDPGDSIRTSPTFPARGSQPRVTVVGEVPPPFRDTQAIEVHAMAERVATPSEAQLEVRFETNTYAHAQR